ncbi:MULTISPECIES: RagB/SusD family nutrient uptake outer membrane protein [unclassified Sphingobacterium]|uniref:RagB/SusD family nutrient uptake outer membrane protein n=1 Tax=unclassified Sphingobacterium TaxID=2609468 RepID=UPI0025EF0886|nr:MULTISPECIES: RagB/SusD family nutrient uptake outer membrane protein [unclassified Sphingobacterium]
MKKVIILGLLFALNSACNPDFLDIKRDRKQVIPISLDDFNLLLGDVSLFSGSSASSMATTAGEEFTISENSWDLLTTLGEKNAYLWQDERFMGTECPDWNYGYKRILSAHIILEGLAKIERTSGNANVYDQIKGKALFHRANANFHLASEFAAPIGDEEHRAYGLPLRKSADPQEVSIRSSVSETYDSILEDLLAAQQLLGDESTDFYQPSKSTANAMLARVYLAMGRYNDALEAAKMVLDGAGKLLNYQNFSASSRYSFPSRGVGNSEILFYDQGYSTESVAPTKGRINADLITSYAENDLRKNLFFKLESDGLYSYKGSYVGSSSVFTGLALDEMYLIYAECLIRAGQVQLGLDKLNELLVTRFAKNTYQEYKGLEKNAALDLVLLERRKQLLIRGLRWIDLRRFNFIENRNIELHRTLAGKIYTIMAKDLKYTFLVPNNVIINSKVTQFPR